MREPLIYKITNEINGKAYFGQTVDYRGRVSYHKSLLRRGKHDNSLLQRDWDEVGEKCFVFEVVEVSNTEEIDDLERRYIDNNSKGTYNLESGGKKGSTHSESTKEKMSNWHKNKTLSKEHRENVSKNHGMPCAKLTIEDVKAIKRLLNDGEKVSEIAKSFGMSRDAIKDIKKNKSWKQVTI